MTQHSTEGQRQRRRIQKELVDTLSNLRLMQTPSSRVLMVEELRERLDGFTVPDQANVRLQVVEIVRACLRADAIDVMIEVMELLEPGTREFAQLQRLRDEWEVVGVLTADDWTELRPMLSKLAPANLSWLYGRATDWRNPGLPGWCTNAWHGFVHLAGQGADPDGFPPSVSFLMLLETEVDSEIAARIGARNQRFATSHELTRELEERRARAKRGEDEPVDATAYLVIQIEPDLAPPPAPEPAGERYLVSHVRQWRGPDSWYSRPGTAVTAAADELEARVEAIVDDTVVEWHNRVGRVVVEFVLPWELLNVEVAWWRRELASERPTALAMDFPVVVRSLERIRASRWHRAWHQRWRQLTEFPSTSRPYWSRPNGGDYFTRLENDLKSDHQVVSLVLSEPPGPSGVGRQEIEAALRAGLPAVVWHRLNCASADFYEAVTELMSDGGLARLPDGAKELRGQALRRVPVEREKHVGRHLTVLWDDPERKPDLGGPSGKWGVR